MPDSIATRRILPIHGRRIPPSLSDLTKPCDTSSGKYTAHGVATQPDDGHDGDDSDNGDSSDDSDDTIKADKTVYDTLYEIWDHSKKIRESSTGTHFPPKAQKALTPSASGSKAASKAGRSRVVSFDVPDPTKRHFDEICTLNGTLPTDQQFPPLSRGFMKVLSSLPAPESHMQDWTEWVPVETIQQHVWGHYGTDELRKGVLDALDILRDHAEAETRLSEKYAEDSQGLKDERSRICATSTERWEKNGKYLREKQLEADAWNAVLSRHAETFPAGSVEADEQGPWDMSHRMWFLPKYLQSDFLGRVLGSVLDPDEAHADEATKNAGDTTDPSASQTAQTFAPGGMTWDLCSKSYPELVNWRKRLEESNAGDGK